MSPKKHKSASVSHMGALIKGILYGLAFFLPGIIVIKHWDTFDQIYSGVASMPVITKISRDFKTGVTIAGALFLDKSIQFYQTNEVQVGPEGPSNPKAYRNSPYAWKRSQVEAKLAREFGKKKVRRARNFLDYIEQYQDMAVREMYATRIPASITIAQGLLESRAGKSVLAIEAKNHFGIKCRKRRGAKKDGRIDRSDYYHHPLAYDCMQRTDDHAWDHFEMYESVDRSFRHHSLLLADSKRYNWMLSEYFTGENYTVDKKWFGETSVPYYAAWSIGLKKSGYATSKRYAQKLALIIETYELWQIDYSVVMSVD